MPRIAKINKPDQMSIAKSKKMSEKTKQRSPFRSPAHWLDYPNLIQGAIQKVTAEIGDTELRRKVVNCLTEVMNNQSSMRSAYQTHFQTVDKRWAIPKRYIIAARQLLIDRLGKQKRGTDRGLLPNLNANTTFEPLNLLSLVGGSSKKDKIAVVAAVQPNTKANAIDGHTMSENVIVCRFCDKSVSKELLWDHVARDIDYRPFDCEVCAQTFVNKAELIEHEINNDGHKGNYVSKTHKFKEEMVRHIFSESLKGKVNNGQNEGANRATNMRIQKDDSVNTPMSLTKNSSKLSATKLPDFGKALSGEANHTSAMKRRRRRRGTGPYLVMTKSSRKLLADRRCAQNSAATSVDNLKRRTEQSPPSSKIVLPSLLSNSTNSKDENAKQSPIDQQSINQQSNVGSNDSKSKGKSRMLEYDNGARVEYENIDSDASWETDSDIVVAEKFSSVNNNFSFVRENVNKNISSNKVLTKTSISSFNGIEGGDLLVRNNSNDLPLRNCIPKKTVKSKQMKWNSIKKTMKFIMCKECGKEISNRSTTLQSHINSKHLKLALYECPRCPKSFYELSNRNARKHMRKMHGRKSISELINNRLVNSAELKKKAVREKFFGPIENAASSCSSSSEE